ncbi:MAG: rhodanese-like domain-containing protein [Methylotenera sp.]|jgi:rhodanese-related sulfurtransferase
MRNKLLVVGALFFSVFLMGPVYALDVQITQELPSIDVMHNGKKVTIMRNQDTANTINPDYAITSRKCPPFCIRPIKIAEGVETLGELEVIDYLKMKSDGADDIVVIDSRTPDWVAKGTIPGAINIPWTKLSPAKGASFFEITGILQKQFGVTEEEGGLMNFSKAKTLVMFCNGMWCGQSPRNILQLLKVGYPANKIKWYRGGMQNWEALGLTTVKP